MRSSPNCQSPWNFPSFPFEAILLWSHVLCLGFVQSRCARGSDYLCCGRWQAFCSTRLKLGHIPSPASLFQQLSAPWLLGAFTLAEYRWTFCPLLGFLWGRGWRCSCSSGAVDCTSVTSLFCSTNLDSSDFYLSSNVLVGMPPHGFVWCSWLVMLSAH